MIDLIVDVGDWSVPETLKGNPEFLYWLQQRSYRLHSKRILKKIEFGEHENNYTIKGFKNLLMMSGKSKKEADLAGAKLYLARKDAR